MEVDVNSPTDVRLRDRVGKILTTARNKIANYVVRFGGVTKEAISAGGPRRDLINVLEIDTDHLKLAQFKRTPTGLRWIGLALVEISPLADPQAPTVIANLSDRTGQGNKGKLVVSLPRHSVMIRRVLLPSTSEEEIERMIIYQAPKYVPYGEDEITVDYHLISKREDGYSEVMLVIVHNDAVNSYLRLLREAKVQPVTLGLGSEAIYTFYINSRDGQSRPAHETVALVDVGDTHTNVLVICEEELVSARSVDVGASRMLAKNGKEESCQEELFSELAHTFAGYGKDSCRHAISKIILTGVASPHLRERIQRAFRLPVESLDPLAGLQAEEGVAHQIRDKSERFSFSTVIGLALEGSGRRINLLPKILRERSRREARNRELLKTGVLCLCVIISATILLHKRIDTMEQYRDELNRQLVQLAPRAEKLERMRREIRIIEKELDFRNSILEVLRELYQTVPRQVSLSLFSFEGARKVTLKGNSPTMVEVLHLIPKLENSELFRDVTVQYLNKRETKDREFVEFLLQLQLATEETR